MNKNQQKNNIYKILGVDEKANFEEIKLAYRKLVKKHHPDAGGDNHKILEINAAWEIVRDKEKRAQYDQDQKAYLNSIKIKQPNTNKTSNATNSVQKNKRNFAIEDELVSTWMQRVYIPIDRLLNQIINPFPLKIKELSADPYDDLLMESFCNFLEESDKKIKRVKDIYISIAAPNSISEFSLNLYRCLSQVQDSLTEFERYTMGYVDNYLHDGKEMLKEAKKKQHELKAQKSNIAI
tara:strand:- start:112 stop:822 length:711 start_codon:yes stop_codon:yes gene_type:complete